MEIRELEISWPGLVPTAGLSPLRWTAQLRPRVSFTETTETLHSLPLFVISFAFLLSPDIICSFTEWERDLTYENYLCSFVELGLSLNET